MKLNLKQSRRSASGLQFKKQSRKLKSELITKSKSNMPSSSETSTLFSSIILKMEAGIGNLNIQSRITATGKSTTIGDSVESQTITILKSSAIRECSPIGGGRWTGVMSFTREALRFTESNTSKTTQNLEGTLLKNTYSNNRQHKSIH